MTAHPLTARTVLAIAVPDDQLTSVKLIRRAAVWMRSNPRSFTDAERAFLADVVKRRPLDPLPVVVPPSAAGALAAALRRESLLGEDEALELAQRTLADAVACTERGGSW